MNEAEKLKNVSLIFEHKCLSFSDIDNSVTLENKNNEVIKIFPENYNLQTAYKFLESLKNNYKYSYKPQLIQKYKNNFENLYIN